MGGKIVIYYRQEEDDIVFPPLFLAGLYLFLSEDGLEQEASYGSSRHKGTTITIAYESPILYNPIPTQYEIVYEFDSRFLKKGAFPDSPRKR